MKWRSGFEASARRAIFGDAFVEHHAVTRKWKSATRKAITDWEMVRHFEII